MYAVNNSISAVNSCLKLCFTQPAGYFAGNVFEGEGQKVEIINYSNHTITCRKDGYVAYSECYFTAYFVGKSK